MKTTSHFKQISILSTYSTKVYYAWINELLNMYDGTALQELNSLIEYYSKRTDCPEYASAIEHMQNSCSARPWSNELGTRSK